MYTEKSPGHESSNMEFYNMDFDLLRFRRASLDEDAVLLV